MILLFANIIVALILSFFDIKYLYSFEIAFICSLFIFFASFKSMQKKVHAMARLDDGEDISKKRRFAIGATISLGLFRIISYVFLGFCIVGLINNELFFIIPFIIGTATSSISMALLLFKKKSSS